MGHNDRGRGQFPFFALPWLYQKMECPFQGRKIFQEWRHNVNIYFKRKPFAFSAISKIMNLLEYFPRIIRSVRLVIRNNIIILMCNSSIVLTIQLMCCHN